MRKIVTTIALLTLFSTQEASAGGFILPNTGAKAAGMTGAWVAQGDDLSVMDHNPAQLVRQKQYGAELHYTAYNFAARFEPAPLPGLGGAPVAENSGDYINHIPNLYGVFPVHERVVLGAGIFTPIGPRHTYSDSGAQRLQIQQAQLQLVWGTLAAAWRASDNISLSLSADIGYVNAYQKIGLGLIPGFRTFEGSIIVNGSGIQMPRPKLGVLYTPAEDISIGLVLLPGMDLKIRGTVGAEVPQVGFHPDRDKDTILAKQRVPSEARLAFGWTPAPFRVEASFRYYRWSEYTAQTIDLKNNKIGAFTIEDIQMDKYYQDNFAVQLGGGYRFLDRHEVRAGYTFDSQAAKNEGITINDFDAPKHILGLGYGFDITENYYANLSFNQVFYVDRKVENSKTAPISVLGEAPNMGNGTYGWNVQTAAIQVGGRF